MKLSFICTALVLALAFIVGPNLSLEAKHRNYFSFNFGGPAYAYAPPAVVVPAPAVVEQRYYVDPYGYPCYDTVYVQPRPYYVYPRPAFYSGFSFGVGFR